MLANKPKGTVKTIEADSGDVIDFVDIHKQPAFDHPLIKNHTLQSEPTWQAYGDASNKAKHESIFDMSWQKHGGCPKGSVPIMRPFLTDDKIMGKNICSRYPDPSASRAAGHQYAVIHYPNGQPTIQGASATISIWKPRLASRNSDFSLSQIWITSGSGSNLQTIEAGWQVFPGRTGSEGPKLFVYSTPDNYSTGCYDYGRHCPGWVQTSPHYSPGMSLQPSTYGGQQSELAMNIRRDPSTGNWWLSLRDTPIGYWASSIFKRGPLAISGADTVSWGGEIYDTSGSSGFHTSTEMGSGYLASAGYGYASYVKDIFFTDYNGNRYAPTENQLRPSAPALNCYNYQFQRGSTGLLYFFYGGPGCR